MLKNSSRPHSGWPLWLSALIAVLLIGLSLTPYFLLAVVIAIALNAVLRPLRSQFLDSFVSRLVVQFLVLGALTMSTAMYCWFVRIAVQPVYVVAPYLLLYLITKRYFTPARPPKNYWITRDDVVAAVLSSAGIVILLASFYLPRPSLASSIQIITNGYDNTSHLSLIQTTYNAQGYLYGNYSSIKNKISWKPQTAYPQGWHYANAFLWRGISLHAFDGTDMSLRINLYVATVLFWQFIMVFVFTRLSLYAARLLGLKKELWCFGGLIAFVGANLLLQLLIFWGVLNFGFVTFVSAITYSLLLVAFLFASYEERGRFRLLCYLGGLLSAAAVSMSWLFPAPEVLAMLAMVFGGSLYGVPLKKILAFRRRRLAWGYVVGSIVIGVPILAQIAINLLYSTEGSGQINDEGGIFSISSALILVLFGFVSLSIMWGRRVQPYIRSVYVAIIGPAFLFSGLVFAYQLFSVGHNAYFFTKSFSLAVVLLGVFLGGTFVKALSTLDFPQWPQAYMAITAVTIVAVTVMFSGQTTATFNDLFQHKSNLTYPVANTMARLARNGTLVKGHTLIFTNGSYVGTIFTITASHHVTQCAADGLWVEITARPNLFPYYMQVCAKEGNDMTVITTLSTYDAIAGLHNPRIHAILAK